MDKKLYNILQHYNDQEQSFVRKIWNSSEDVVFKNNIVQVGFCNPNECKIIEEISSLFNIKVLQNGGYEKAELKNVILLNKDIEITNDVCLFEIKYNTKFNELTHRQIMGTLYNQGISERLLGDIIVSSDKRCQFIVANELKDVLEIMVLKIGSIPVKYELINEITIEPKKLNSKIRSSRSLRIDAICKSISFISRNKIAKDILKGYVSVNHKVIKDLKYEIKEEDLISIKGHGRIIIKKIIPVNGKYNIKFETTKE